MDGFVDPRWVYTLDLVWAWLDGFLVGSHSIFYVKTFKSYTVKGVLTV